MVAAAAVCSSREVLPRSFSGASNDDIEEWILDFEQIGNANGWTDAIKAQKLGLLLTGSAKQWYRMTFTRPPYSWADASDRLREAFRPERPELHFYSKMIERKQELGEGTIQYIVAKSALIDKCNPEIEIRDRISMIMRGFLPNIIEKLYTKNIVTMHGLTCAAKLASEAHQIANQRPEAASMAADLIDSIMMAIPPSAPPEPLAKPPQGSTRFLSTDSRLRQGQERSQRRLNEDSRFRGQQKYNGEAQRPTQNFSRPNYRPGDRSNGNYQPSRRPSERPLQQMTRQVDAMRVETRTCFACGRPGHLQRFCKARQQANNYPKNGQPGAPRY